MAYVTTASGDRKSQWNLLALPLILVFCIGLPLLANLGIDHLQRMTAPAGTLLISRPKWAIFVIFFYPWCIPGMPISLWLFNTISSHIPFLRREFAEEDASKHPVIYTSAMRFFIKLTLITTGFAIICSLLTIGNYTAVYATGMVQHTFLGMHTKQYSWDDIVEVKATCRDTVSRSRRDLELSYFVIMSDGASANLLVSDFANAADAFPVVYKEIHPILISHPGIRRSANMTILGLSLLDKQLNKNSLGSIHEALFTALGKGRL